MKKCIYLGVNILLKILILFPKNKKIWIFGAWHGDKYADNTRYFYEYLKNNDISQKVKLVWITKNKEVLKKLKNENEVYLNNSLKGFWYKLRAGVVFYTNGMQDFGEIDLSNGSYRIALWHGMPLKRIYFASNKIIKQSNKFIKALRIIKNKLYFRAERNLTIATSEECKEKLNECFSFCKNNEFIISGQPRNDILVSKDIKFSLNEVIKVKNYSNNFSKIITYMPTYRSIKNLKEEQVKRIESLLKNKKFQNFLKEQNILFIVKIHYLMDLNENIDNKNIIFLKDSEIECTQKLLKLTDILITDYSSVFIDFVLQEEKSTLFYGYDSKKYFLEDEAGLFYDYDNLVKDYLIKEEKELLKRIKETLDNQKGNNMKLNRFFNKETYMMNNFSENILDFLNKKQKNWKL